MTAALIDDQLLGHVLRGRRPRVLATRDLHTTGYWYVRLCQAVLNADERTGVRSGPFADLSATMFERATAALLELPDAIGLMSLRELAPTIAQLRVKHQLNILSIEALAAAKRLNATVYLSASSPLLELAIKAEGLAVRMLQVG